MENQNPTQLHLITSNFKTKTFFDRLGKSVVATLDTDFGTALVELLGTVQDESVATKCLELIFNALAKSCRGILKADDERQKMLDAIPNLVERSKGLKKDIADKLVELEIAIDTTFFDAPHKTDFIQAIKPIYQEWLQHQIGFTAAQSKSLAAALPLEFRKELARLWTEKPDYYKEIKTYFDNPFFKSIKEDQLRTSYYTELQSHYSKPVFGSPEMMLADIYIEPNFKVYKRCFPEAALEKDELKPDDDGFVDVPYEGGALHQYIIDFFQNRHPLGLEAEKSNFLILLGQPGQGKTSFCLRTLYDLLSQDLIAIEDRSIFFVRLRYVNVSDILNNPLETIRKHIADADFKSDQAIPLEAMQNAILILDGLDELYMHQGLTNADIKNLVKGLSDELYKHKGLKIVLSTRYNYLKVEELSRDKFLILKLAALSLAQQLTWLQKYKAIYPDCTLTAETIQLINESKEKKYKGIKELINQPILLQMIARSGLDVSDGSNRAKIYETLFDNVINRRWSSDKQLDKYEKLKEKELRAFLQTIALAIYHSEHEYVRKAEFESNEMLSKAKDRFLKKIDNKMSFEDALKDILVSFYFKNKQKAAADNKDDKDRHEEYAIEFLHKSLQEYLVAEKIWYFFKTRFTSKNSEEEYIIEDWKDALKEVFAITSPKIISEEITSYLIEIIENDDSINKGELIERLEYFLPFLIKRDFIYSYNLQHDIEPINLGLASFYAYWTVLSHLQDKNTIPEDCKERFVFLLISLSNFHFNLKMKIKNANLVGVNLYGGNFANSDLSGTDLRKSDLSGIVLSNSFLSKSSLDKTLLDGAFLNEVFLVGASLISTSMRGTNLGSANLTGANLSQSHLEGAILSGTHFFRADLSYSNLAGANLLESNLSHATLTDVRNLTYEQLSQVHSLKGSIGIPKDIKQKLLETHAHLFEQD